MSWTRNENGRFERPYDPMDAFMVRLQHMVINASVLLDFGHLDNGAVVDGLKQAWKVARIRHPSIATTLDHNKDCIVYQPADAAILEDWVAQTFLVEKGTFAMYSARAMPTMPCALHYFPASQELVLRAHHWIIDGIGAMQVLRKVLQFLASNAVLPELGQEYQFLPPGFDELCHVSASPSQAATDAASKMVMDFVGNLPSIGLPSAPKEHQGDGTAKKYVKKASMSTSGALVTACKQRGISVASAVHAAIITATQEMKVSDSMAQNYTSILVYNWRKCLPAPYCDVDTYPANNFVLGLPVSRGPSSFGDHAAALQQAYSRPQQGDRQTFIDSVFAYSKQLAGAFGNAPPVDMIQSCLPQLSSIGILDNIIDHTFPGVYPVSVKDAEVGVHILDASIPMYQWSWQGEFHLSACFNTAFLTDEAVERFVDRVFAILVDELIVVESPALSGLLTSLESTKRRSLASCRDSETAAYSAIAGYVERMQERRKLEQGFHPEVLAGLLMSLDRM